jgi:hypothetical protein
MGFQTEVPWYYLESAAGGQYFFDPASPNYTASNIIDATLAYLATKSAHDGVDYKLIIYLPINESLGSVGTVPQAVAYSAGTGSTSTSIAPDYIITGLTSGAGSGVVKNSYNYPCVAIWRQNEMTAFINLVNKLGAVYDSNPHVEAIIPIYETGNNLSTLSDSTYSAANLITQLNRLATAMQSSWPTTNKILFANWSFTDGTIAQLTTLAQTFVAANFGIGGPDILHNAGGWPTNGAQILVGAGGSFGTTNYQGTIPILYEDQANWSNWTSQTQAGTESYAYNTLKYSHVVWTYSASLGPAGTNWSDTIAALDAVNFRVASPSCPTSYASGCTN